MPDITHVSASINKGSEAVNENAIIFKSLTVTRKGTEHEFSQNGLKSKKKRKKPLLSAPTEAVFRLEDINMDIKKVLKF